MINNFVFPEWSPKEVVQEWEKLNSESSVYPKEIKEANQENTTTRFLNKNWNQSEEWPGALYRLLTHLDMKEAWERMGETAISKGGFYLILHLAYFPRSKSEVMAEKELRDWRNDIEATASKLADLIEFSCYDDILESRFSDIFNTLKEKRMISEAFAHFALDKTEDEIEENEKQKTEFLIKVSNKYRPPLLSSVLRDLGGMREDVINRSGIPWNRNLDLQSRPNKKTAQRIRFARQLTFEMLQIFGEPKRDIVARCVRAAFDVPGYDENQLGRDEVDPLVKTVFSEIKI